LETQNLRLFSRTSFFFLFIFQRFGRLCSKMNFFNSVKQSRVILIAISDKNIGSSISSDNSFNFSSN
ncbi:hypothetical protein, partial [Olivibacter sp. XZL3]|uniref:hypothetical protein n=1 Tax=Olivibacter sp. XZL3 TaxID=1735116 RepID=UPI001981419C